MVALLNNPPTDPAMKLHPAEDPRERRIFPRKEIHARVEGKRIDHRPDALRLPHLSLALRDLSIGGCSAISHTPLERGERLSVFFPPQGNKRGWDAQARVIRCEISATGYRVAMAFDPLPAA